MTVISIHAPAKGATGRIPHKNAIKTNFNPRSREGSDTRSMADRNTMLNFNPRSREGSDLIVYSLKLPLPLFQSTLPRRERRSKSQILSISAFISIHAPAKGATTGESGVTMPANDFNPRSREGSDEIKDKKILSIQIFQSTLPRRERRIHMYQSYFLQVFQSTLPRRERPHSQIINLIVFHFNPRSREGSDQNSTLHQCNSLNFNPRSREGSDKRIPPVYAVIPNFNPRSREGSDHRLRSSFRMIFRFQSTLPRRERQQYYTTNFIFFV